MKLSKFAKSLGISYWCAWKMHTRKELNSFRLPSGTIIVKIKEGEDLEKAIVYKGKNPKDKGGE